MCRQITGKEQNQASQNIRLTMQYYLGTLTGGMMVGGELPVGKVEHQVSKGLAVLSQLPLLGF